MKITFTNNAPSELPFRHMELGQLFTFYRNSNEIWFLAKNAMNNCGSFRAKSYRLGTFGVVEYDQDTVVYPVDAVELIVTRR